MSAWNITAPADLIASLAQSSISQSNKNTFAAVNSAGFNSDYAKILAAQLAQVDNEFKESVQNLSEENLTTENTMPVIETIKRFRPDGSIMITTYKDGSIDSTTKIKPHLVPTPDYSAPKTPEGQTDIKYVQRFSLGELLML
ncbi:MAG: hypothetical protein IJT73_09755 [Selenomonadaceae bacterium]|nr:hypothetical protein [Selenomonadaceae bacterium]